MLNTGYSVGYKALAKKAQKKECLISDNPVSELIVDFRSRLFRYIRLVYPLRTRGERVCSVFRTMKDLDSTNQVVTEKRRAFIAALNITKNEIEYAHVPCTYVFGSLESCPYKKHIKANRKVKTDERLKELKRCVVAYKQNLLCYDALEKCAKALDNYLISDLDGVATVYNGDEWMLNVNKYMVPNADDLFESDRLCVRLATSSNAAVFSEDFDNILLFGSDMMVLEIHKKFFVYATLKDTLGIFGSDNRLNAVYKCCLMGTDYNRGLQGVGPVKSLKIDETESYNLFKTCMAAQSINPTKMMKFLLCS